MPATRAGYRPLIAWAEGFGPVGSAGVEGTGSYGAGRVRHLRTEGVPVLEVERPKRRTYGARASPTLSTPRRRPGRSSRARLPENPGAATAGSRWSGPSESGSTLRGKHGSVAGPCPSSGRPAARSRTGRAFSTTRLGESSASVAAPTPGPTSPRSEDSPGRPTVHSERHGL
jgi:hypothetical protein